MALYRNFRSEVGELNPAYAAYRGLDTGSSRTLDPYLFLGFIGFLSKAAKGLMYSYPP